MATRRWIAVYKSPEYSYKQKAHRWVNEDGTDYVYTECAGPPPEWAFKYKDYFLKLEKFLSSADKILTEGDNWIEISPRKICGNCFSIRNYKVRVNPYYKDVWQGYSQE